MAWDNGRENCTVVIFLSERSHSLDSCRLDMSQLLHTLLSPNEFDFAKAHWISYFDAGLF